MKLAFVMLAFQSNYVLEPCLKSIAPYGKIYAAEGPVRFWQEHGFTHSTDGTSELLDKYCEDVIHSEWEEKDGEANGALILVPPDTDFIWCVDSDEIWKPDQIETVMRLLETGFCDSLSFKPFSFYGGFERYMGGFEENNSDSKGWHRVMPYAPQFKTHRPPTTIEPKSHLSHHATADMGLRFFHYSYVFPTQIKDKTEYYAARGGTIDDYFTRVYLPWVTGTSEQQQAIEDEFDGVHDWEPQNRGECRTLEFLGKHPPDIAKVMPQLKERFELELAEYR